MWKFLARAWGDQGDDAAAAAAAAQGGEALGGIGAAAAAAAGGAAGGAQGAPGSLHADEEGVDDVAAELEGAASPARPPLGRLPSAAASPDMGMLWEVQPPMGISPAMPFMTGHPMHSAMPPAAPPLTTAGGGALAPSFAGGSSGNGAEALPGSTSGSRKSPRLSPALLAHVRAVDVQSCLHLRCSAHAQPCSCTAPHSTAALLLLQASPGPASVGASPGLLRLDATDAWFGSDAGGGGSSIFPPLADLFKDPADAGTQSVLNL